MIEIEGNLLAVKKALVSVSQCLQDCSRTDKTRAGGSKHINAFSQATVPDLRVDSLSHRNLAIPMLASSSINKPSNSINLPSITVGFASLPLEAERFPTLSSKTQPHDLVFKLLCSNDKIGGVIGKGGSVVKALQNETGAAISVGSPVSECDDRLITITASEDPESQYSPAQKAVVLVFSRSERDCDSSNGSSVTARLAVASNQVGCLLGKGGVIISEIRKATGANIRIIGGGGNQVPKCLSANEEVVQISGKFSSVQDALYNATGKLRDNLFSNGVNSVGTRPASSLLTENSPYGKMNASSLMTDMSPYGKMNASSLIADTSPYRRMREPALLFAANDPPLYEINGSPPIGFTNRISQQSTLAQNLDYLGLPHTFGRPHSPQRYAFNRPPSPRQYAFERPPSPRQYALERPLSPRSWESQMVAGPGARGNHESGRFVLRAGGLELGSGSKSAFVTNTTVEIRVPETVIDSVYGENGNNLTRLRQISGARVIVHELQPGTSDRVIVISGTPDETQAAQSLLHAFILTGPS